LGASIEVINARFKDTFAETVRDISNRDDRTLDRGLVAGRDTDHFGKRCRRQS
jgi:hypothetical protein